MLSPKETLDTYYLAARRDFLEVAALQERYYQAVLSDGQTADDERKLQILRQAMNLLVQPDHPKANRAEQLLEHFSTIN